MEEKFLNTLDTTTSGADVAALAAEGSPGGCQAIICCKNDRSAAENIWGGVPIVKRCPADGTVSDVESKMKAGRFLNCGFCLEGIFFHRNQDKVKGAGSSSSGSGPDTCNNKRFYISKDGALKAPSFVFGWTPRFRPESRPAIRSPIPGLLFDREERV